jgi:hypothetical protein
VAAAALLLGTPVLAGQAAHAQSTGTVRFTGGCASELAQQAGTAVAEPAHPTVEAGAELRFVNQLGTRATLSLNGTPAVELSPGGAVGVRLHDGPVTVTVEISCPQRAVRGATTIEVVGPGTLPPAATPTSPGGGIPPAPAATTSGAAAEVLTAGPAAGPGGLLAAIAVICVVGVSAVAVRAILARRPARTGPV